MKTTLNILMVVALVLLGYFILPVHTGVLLGMAVLGGNFNRTRKPKSYEKAVIKVQKDDSGKLFKMIKLLGAEGEIVGEINTIPFEISPTLNLPYLKWKSDNSYEYFVENDEQRAKVREYFKTKKVDIVMTINGVKQTHTVEKYYEVADKQYPEQIRFRLIDINQAQEKIVSEMTTEAPPF